MQEPSNVEKILINLMEKVASQEKRFEEKAASQEKKIDEQEKRIEDQAAIIATLRGTGIDKQGVPTKDDDDIDNLRRELTEKIEDLGDSLHYQITHGDRVVQE